MSSPIPAADIRQARNAVDAWTGAVEDFVHSRPWHLQSKRRLPSSMEYPNDARWTDRLDDMTAELYDMPWAPLILALEEEEA